MSIYQPKHGTLKAIQQENGWWVYDLYGPFDGPYETQGDALHVIQGIEEAHS